VGAARSAAGRLPAIGGNHGEAKRRQVVHDVRRQRDVEVIRAGRRDHRPEPRAYGHVRFHPAGQPDDHLDIGGTIVGMAHGHQARKGATPQARMKDWWKGQAFGFRPVGDASLLLPGTTTSLMVDEDGPRTLIMAPTIDSGSQWWEETAGNPSVGRSPCGPNGWDDLKLL
jgi:hypothetical protein